MKKVVVILLIAAAAFTVGTFIFIPNALIIDRSSTVNNNLHSVYRSFSEAGNWHKWWPGEAKDTNLYLNGNRYNVKYRTTSSVFVDIEASAVTIPSALNFIPGEKNTVTVNWYAKTETAYNPIKRLQQYLAFKKANQQIETLLKKMSSFGTTTANLYGLDIRRELVKDSALISISDSSIGYPSSEKIYSVVDELRQYIQTQGAFVSDSVMLNVYTKDNIHYLLKIALPTSRRLPSKGKIEYRWMLGGGNILVADVTGDQKRVDRAYTIMENYVQDHQLMAPAVSFISLTTNRLAEKDSTKWITRIYYPVMYYYD